MKSLKKMNIFSMMAVTAALGFSFRLADIVMFRIEPARAAVEVVKEEPPPITKGDVEKAVNDTAKAVESMPEEKGTATSAAAAAKPLPPIPDIGNRSFSSSEIDVLQSLSKRRDELDQREKTTIQREALLKAAAQEVDRKIVELNKLKGDMEKLLGQQQQAQEGRILSLVKIYENMKPGDAARIFDTLEMDILLDVVGRMNERKVSPILASMNPERARDITIKLADERRLPGLVPAK